MKPMIIHLWTEKKCGLIPPNACTMSQRPKNVPSNSSNFFLSRVWQMNLFACDQGNEKMEKCIVGDA